MNTTPNPAPTPTPASSPTPVSSASPIPPLPVDRWADGLLDRTRTIVGGDYRSDANVYRTLANSPKLFEAWLHLGGKLLRRSSLDPLDRERAILRTTALARGGYPFAQHVRIGREVGLGDGDIDAVTSGTDPSPTVAAVDELLFANTLSAETWQALGAESDPSSVVANTLDLVATVAFYRMASWVLNTAGTPLDDGSIPEPPPVQPLSGAFELPAPGPAATVRLARRPVQEWPADLLDATAAWPRFVGRPEIRSAGVYTTLANHPELFMALGPLMAHLLEHHSLSDRQRELVIVRTCLRDRGEYPYRQHVRIGAELGLDQELLAQLAAPSPALSDPDDAALAAAVDSLHDHHRIVGVDELLTRFTPTQVMDLVVTAGFYGLVSFVLNSAGTTLEPTGEARLPADTPTKGFS